MNYIYATIEHKDRMHPVIEAEAYVKGFECPAIAAVKAAEYNRAEMRKEREFGFRFTKRTWHLGTSRYAMARPVTGW